MKANYNEVLQTKNRNKKLFTRIKSSKIGIKLLPINRETPKKIEKKKLWTNMPKKIR